MPNLPTISVTDAQADRMMAAYGSVAAYQKWLRNSIINFVLSKEYSAKRQTAEAQWDAETAAGKSDLGYVAE